MGRRGGDRFGQQVPGRPGQGRTPAASACPYNSPANQKSAAACWIFNKKRRATPCQKRLAAGLPSRSGPAPKRDRRSRQSLSEFSAQASAPVRGRADSGRRLGLKAKIARLFSGGLIYHIKTITGNSKEGEKIKKPRRQRRGGREAEKRPKAGSSPVEDGSGLESSLAGAATAPSTVFQRMACQRIFHARLK